MMALLLSAWWLLNGFFVPPVGHPLAGHCPLFASQHERFGINVVEEYGKNIQDYNTDDLGFAWYLDYATQIDVPSTPEVVYLQIVPGYGFDPEQNPVNQQAILNRVDAHPGAIWIVGNEPDRIAFQDSLPPAHFALFYHDVYTLIKEHDLTALVAVGAIVQPTPIRLRYLDMVLAAYREQFHTALPTDIWTVHNFILREATAGWGAGIPPGLEEYASEGMDYGLDDHGRQDLFQAHLVQFRRWMARNGYRGTPLFLTEYGNLMPPIYGYTSAFVRRYMVDTFDWLMSTRDESIGYPADDNRLVQAWGWYSLNDKQYNPDTGQGFNGNLLDHDTGAITNLGETFASYVAPLRDLYADPMVVDVHITQGSFLTTGQAITLTINLVLANGGPQSATDVDLSVWYTPAASQREQLDARVVPLITARCRITNQITIPWPIADLPPGPTLLSVEIASQDDRDPSNNSKTTVVHGLQDGQPIIGRFLPLMRGRQWAGQ